MSFKKAKGNVTAMEIFTTDERKAGLKEKIAKRDGEYGFIGYCLKYEAQKAIGCPLYSVTYTKSRAASGNPHDYYSEAPYWWPNPENPDGPFIRRDGEIYPGRFEKHTLDMSEMAKAVYILSCAGYFFESREYTAKAEALLDNWFINAGTAMNPSLDYAQAISGVSLGRGIGIIDTAALILVISAMDYFTAAGGSKETTERLKDWFGKYVTWMDTSKNGKDERDYFNNHANWWNTQAASFSAFSGDTAMAKRCFDRLINKIIPEQTGPDGEFIDELTRTNSLTYCLYNLEACIVTAQAAAMYGIDLYSAETLDGKGIRKSLDYMFPFYKNPYTWEHKQISGRNIAPSVSFQLARERLDKKYASAQKLRSAGVYPLANLGHIGALCFLDGYRSDK